MTTNEVLALAERLICEQQQQHGELRDDEDLNVVVAILRRIRERPQRDCPPGAVDDFTTDLERALDELQRNERESTVQAVHDLARFIDENARHRAEMLSLLDTRQADAQTRAEVLAALDAQDAADAQERAEAAALLAAWQQGDETARDRLWTLLYLAWQPQPEPAQ